MVVHSERPPTLFQGESCREVTMLCMSPTKVTGPNSDTYLYWTCIFERCGFCTNSLFIILGEVSAEREVST